ncbi:hypothetical protein [Novacetimonas sp. GS1]|uniref:hypothetical protein n=1 Tax=Novacetimonas sp. GS1 TaxID=3119990 RepID=UPI002FCD0F8E
MFDWLFGLFRPDHEEVAKLRRENRDLGRELAAMQLALAMMRVQRDDALKMSERRDRRGRFAAQGARLTEHKIPL